MFGVQENICYRLKFLGKMQEQLFTRPYTRSICQHGSPYTPDAHDSYRLLLSTHPPNTFLHIIRWTKSCRSPFLSTTEQHAFSITHELSLFYFSFRPFNCTRSLLMLLLLFLASCNISPYPIEYKIDL